MQLDDRLRPRSMSPAILVFALLAACGRQRLDGGTDRTDGGPASDAGTSASAANPGFDCYALLEKQNAANCPKFDAVNYRKDCNDTKSKIPASCMAQADALGNCLLEQPFGCTEDGAIDSNTPAACKGEEDALMGCTKP